MKHHEKIDGLRTVAVAFVLVEHFADRVGKLVSAGYYGVDLFFVISGFLITGILLDSKGSFGKAYGRFVGRRTLRIFPIYYLMLGVLLLLGHQQVCWYLPWFATYTFNYAWVALNVPVGSATHLWSLAVEEQFYLVWPFLVLALRRWPRVLLGITGALVVASFVQLVGRLIPAVNPYNFSGLFPRAGSLGLGAVGAILYRLDLLPRRILASTWFERVALLVLVASLLSPWPAKFPLLALCSLVLVLKAATEGFSSRWIDRFLVHPWVQHVGKVSYGVYLFHLPLGYWLTTWWVSPWWCSRDFASWGQWSFLKDFLWVAMVPVYGALSVGLATLSHRWIEQPILGLKDRWFPRG